MGCLGRLSVEFVRSEGWAVAGIPFVLCDHSVLATRKIRPLARGVISVRSSTGERWSGVQQRGLMPCGEGETSGLIEEMDGIEWMVSPVVLVHEGCACVCQKDVDSIAGQRAMCVVCGIPIQGLEM